MIFIGYRKVLVFLVTLLVITALLTLGYITGDNYATILSTVGPSFFMANLAEHFVQKRINSKWKLKLKLMTMEIITL